MMEQGNVKSTDTEEHPRLGGTPLAMLEAQCQKLDSKIPPPLMIVAGGNDFYPEMKREPHSTAGHRSADSVNGEQPPFHLGTSYQRPLTSSTWGAPGAYSGENLFCAPPPLPQSDSQGFIGKVETNPASYLGAVCSRVATHPYENWPATMNAPAKTEIASTSATPCWEVGGPASAPPRFDMSGAAPTLHNYSTDYSHLQHLHHQDTYESMLSGQGSSVPFATLNGPPRLQLPSPRSQSRKTRRTTCGCPNCAEAERLGPAGAHLGKKNIHSCHIPGCGKLHRMTFHLKDHLRQHTGERPFVCNWLSCGKRFTRSVDLQRHLHTHTGEKRFACHFCTKRFMRSDQLSNHVKTHRITFDGKKTGFRSGSCSDTENSRSESPARNLSSPLDPNARLKQPLNPEIPDN